MFEQRIKIVLEHHGFKKYTKQVKFSETPTTFVYLIKEHKNVYLHTTDKPGTHIRTYRSWLTAGNVERLPLPVQRLLRFKATTEPNAYVELYYKEDFADRTTLEKSINYITEPVVRLPPDKTGRTNVIEIRLANDPDFYYLVRFKTGREKYVISQFTTRTLDNLKPNPKSKSKRYIDWTIRNREQVIQKAYVIKHLVTDATMCESDEIMHEYFKTIQGVNLKHWNYV